MTAVTAQFSFVPVGAAVDDLTFNSLIATMQCSRWSQDRLQ